MSHRIILDVEGNNLYATVTRIHCLVTKDIDTGEVRRFRHHGKGKESIEAGLKYVAAASLVVGHNLQGYDLGALTKCYPKFAYTGAIFDTLTVSCLIYTNLFEQDSMQKRIPTPLWGLHKLEAWGYRLKLLKGDYGKQENAWAEWSQAMEDYCVRDVEVTHKLYLLLLAKNYSVTAIELEHEFKTLIVEQERHGFRFDVQAAEKLTAQLQTTRHELTSQLQKVFPPIKETMKKPEYYTAGEHRWATKGEAIKGVRAVGLTSRDITPGPLRIKQHLFNPGSRDQIAARLIERYQWKPRKFTETGKPAIDEGVLAAMPWPEAALLSKFLIVGKTLGQLAEGDNACMKLARAGRIHGSVFTNGAVTGRCTHSKPNIAQTPAVMVVKGEDGKKVPALGLEGGFGWEFRSLYLPDEDQALVGWDASSLELRCLAHYLAKYDGGAFEKVLLEGDVHTANQKAAGFYLRDSAKTFIYAYLYGAGSEKIGKVQRQDCIDAGKPFPKGTLIANGEALKQRFLKNFPALDRLKRAIKATLQERDYLVGLDGRHLHVRSEHAALNTLLQSAGALLMKKALVFQHQFLTTEKRYVLHKDFAFVANIHDEAQTSCRPDIAEVVGKSGPAALKKSGEFFNFRCRLDGEFKIGANWAETH